MIEQVTIRNFKSIGDVTVDLSPLTVLIGRSGVGKSNFLRALRFIRNYLLFGDQAIDAEGGWQHIWPNGESLPLFIRVQFRLPGFDSAFAYELCWRAAQQRDQPRLDFEKLFLGGEVLLAWAGQAWEKWPGEGPTPKHTQPSIQLNQFPTTSEAVLAYAAWTSGIGWYHFPSSVFAQEKAHPSLFGRAGPSLPGLHDEAENYLSVLRDLTQDLRDQRPRRQILARLKQINPTVRSVELDSIQNPQRVIVGHELGGQRVALDLAQESDGLRRYYAHLLALYQNPPKQTLMFEEPENGVFPGALQNLAEEFAAAAAVGRGQVLLTTQSPALLDGFAPENLRVVELDSAQQTRIGPLDPDQAAAVRDDLLRAGELLTVDKARIATSGASTGAASG